MLDAEAELRNGVRWTVRSVRMVVVGDEERLYVRERGYRPSQVLLFADGQAGPLSQLLNSASNCIFTARDTGDQSHLQKW